MTDSAAIHAFFSSFGIPCYTESSLSDDSRPAYPYLTYTPVMDAFPAPDVSITVNLWYRTTDESEPNEMARKILSKLDAKLTCDTGYIWLKKGTPFCQSLSDPVDPAIKRRYSNIDVEFCTTRS